MTVALRPPVPLNATLADGPLGRLGRCLRGAALPALAAALTACADGPSRTDAGPRPEEVRARIVSMLPTSVPDRTGWAADLYAAFAVLRLDPSDDKLCAVLAVVEQESGYRIDPPVPRLGAIAWEEIDRRADKVGVPRLLVHAALKLPSPDGRSYSDRIDGARTEKDLSDLFVDFTRSVPLGERLFAGYNPVRTAGPMQVGIAFAERQVLEKPYPYPIAGTLRDEVFTRRGGLYFGSAHLLDYPADYDQPIYRFADFNAGRYASRNAAFQAAVSSASGIPLALDGDLVTPGGDPGRPGSTEMAVRSLADRLGIGPDDIRRTLEDDDKPGLEQSRLYQRVFALAERNERRTLPRAVLPAIDLSSPKITRKFTTEGFARRVAERQQRCLARISG